MRLNLPVTDTEIALSDTETIVSTTDLQGNITYANPYFVAISGYTLEELIGAPQNILRHPDMPVELANVLPLAPLRADCALLAQLPALSPPLAFLVPAVPFQALSERLL